MPRCRCVPRCYNRADPIVCGCKCERKIASAGEACSRLAWVQVLLPEPGSSRTKARGPVNIPRGLRNVMKRFTTVLMLLIVLAASAFANSAKDAKQLYQKGKLAEARQDYISAY